MGFKVLIVDALQVSRESIAGAVKSVPNVEVPVPGSSFEALNLLDRHRVDLVIASMEMPDLNGLELVNFVKKNPSYRETPLLSLQTSKMKPSATAGSRWERRNPSFGRSRVL